jgi:hypothetical protein
MDDLDESIGKILLELQKDDPDLFLEILKKTKEGDMELLDEFQKNEFTE